MSIHQKEMFRRVPPETKVIPKSTNRECLIKSSISLSPVKQWDVPSSCHFVDLRAICGACWLFVSASIQIMLNSSWIEIESIDRSIDRYLIVLMLEHLTLGDFFLTITNSRNKRLSIPAFARILTAKKHTFLRTMSNCLRVALKLCFFLSFPLWNAHTANGVWCVCARDRYTYTDIIAKTAAQSN